VVVAAIELQAAAGAVVAVVAAAEGAVADQQFRLCPNGSA
jgi:hypothetical protein